VHKTVLMAIALFGLVGTGFAQLPKGNVFFGYSYLSADLGAPSRTGLNGWDASVEGKFLPFLGAVADFSGNYGSAGVAGSGLCTPPPGGLPGGCISVVNADISQHNFLFGIRGSFSVGKVRPFAEAMVGAAHLSENGSGVSNSSTSFAQALGGGLDYHLIPLLSWRVEADYLRTNSFSATQNNARISTGLVFRF